MHLQANPYYCAGRVTVPAIIDTLSASFFNRCDDRDPGLLTERFVLPCAALSACTALCTCAPAAGHETLGCQWSRSMLTELMSELAGDDGRPGGALLRQVHATFQAC